MLSQSQYTIFKQKLNKIVQDSLVESVNDGKLAFMYRGRSSETQDNVYYYDEEQVLKHKDDLIELCRFLPKLNTIIVGTSRNYSFF